VSLIRAVAPQLAIHGSTQMSITSAEGAEFAAGEAPGDCHWSMLALASVALTFWLCTRCLIDCIAS
jgi:hypothetical protein